MEIRTAGIHDVPAIVDLLKISLGEGLMPKSAEYWRWKHIDNPFGQSPVLLAFENDTLVGVRAFMRWDWVNSAGRMVRAVRAVDTATHPDFQGKGIFSTLTKKLLSECEARGIDLVFNTPNEKSMPGYLKMGWQQAGKLPVSITVSRPFNVLKNIIGKNPTYTEFKDDSVSRCLSSPGLEALLDRHRRGEEENFVTAHSAGSLRWRYETVPVTSYFADAFDNNGLKVLYFYRLKKSRFGLEMRITDCFLESDKMEKTAGEMIHARQRMNGADFISIEGISSGRLLGAFSIASSLGPVVTVRKVSGNAIADFINFRHWHPGTGDLELF